MEHIIFRVKVPKEHSFLDPPAKEEIVSVMQRTPQEHMSTIMEEIAAVELFLPQERIQDRIVEQLLDIVVPPVMEEIVHAVQTAMEMDIV